MKNSDICKCGHDRGEHSMRGKCLHYNTKLDKYTCKCERFNLKEERQSDPGWTLPEPPGSTLMPSDT
jgi:hypothetical protein